MGYNTSGSIGGVSNSSAGISSAGRNGGGNFSRNDYGPTRDGGNLADSWEDNGNGYKSSWNLMDGWHMSKNQLTKPSYFDGRMTTSRGWGDPAGVAREKAFYNAAKRQSRMQNEYKARQDFLSQNLPEVDSLDWGTVRGIRQDITDAVNYGDLESLRNSFKFSDNQKERQDKFNSSMDQLSSAHQAFSWSDGLMSLFGKEPDKVETQPGVTKDYLNRGLVEYNDQGNLELTTKGQMYGSMQALGVMPGMSLFSGLFGGATQPLGMSYQKAGNTLSGLAPLSVPHIGLNAAKAFALGAAPLGAMADLYSYGNDLEYMGIAPGGQSLFDLGFDGKVNGLNQGVFSAMLDRAELLATPNEFSGGGSEADQFFSDPARVQAMFNPTQAAARQPDFSWTYPQWRQVFHPNG